MPQGHIDREIGSVYYHGARVAKGVIYLRKNILPDDVSMDDTLRVAAMFHDLSKGIEPHARYGAVLAREALREEVDPATLDTVCALIAAHCDRQPGSGKYDDYALLLQDADLIDHFARTKSG